MKKIYLIGGGGHCHSCIDVIESTGQYKIQGIFDTQERVGEKVLGYPIIDIDDNIEKYKKADCYFLITIGQIKTAKIRKKIFEKNINLATIISPRAYVSSHASVGSGTIVMHDALINSGAVVGKNCIVNTKALIEHDAIIGDHSHISTGAIVNGNCIIGEETFIGSNTVIKNGANVKSESLITYGAKL